MIDRERLLDLTKLLRDKIQYLDRAWYLSQSDRNAIQDSFALLNMIENQIKS
jgi:hypothetical protein